MKHPHSRLDNELSNEVVGGTATVDSSSSLDTDQLLTPPRSIFGRMKKPLARPHLKIVILGPSLTAAQGNGAAATCRGLVRELGARGHEVLLLVRGDGKALSQRKHQPDSGRVEEYSGLKELKDGHAVALRDADCVLVASQIAEATDISEWVTGHAQGVTAFYDNNMPSTLAGSNRDEAVSPVGFISKYSLYLSSIGGPLLDRLEDELDLPMVRPLYPAVEARLFFPEYAKQSWDLGYLGKHGGEYQPALERLLIEPARRWDEGRFVVAGGQHRHSLRWPRNVKRLPQIPAQKRRGFYNSLRFALNITPPDHLAMGYSPSLRLFEAAACGTPVISEFWPGLDGFFTPDEEILVSHSPDETLIYLEEISELDRRRLGYRARERVLARHTTRHRAAELEGYVLELLKRSPV